MNCSLCLLEDPHEPALEAQGQCEGCGRAVCRRHTETCCDTRQCTLCYAAHLNTALPPEHDVVVNLLKHCLLPVRKGRAA